MEGRRILASARSPDAFYMKVGCAREIRLDEWENRPVATITRATMIGGVLAVTASAMSFGRAGAGTGRFQVRHSDAEWHARLNAEQ